MGSRASPPRSTRRTRQSPVLRAARPKATDPAAPWRVRRRASRARPRKPNATATVRGSVVRSKRASRACARARLRKRCSSTPPRCWRPYR
jgi:hypothetical protein